MAGNPIQGGAQVIAQQSSGRKTALALVLAITAAELVLSGRMQTVWHALWGPMQPLSTPSAPAPSIDSNGPNAGQGGASPSDPSEYPGGGITT